MTGGYFEEEQYNKPFSFREWAGMLPFFKPYKKQMIQLTALMLLCAVIDTLFPIYQMYIIDNYIVPRSGENLLPAILIGVAGIAFMSVATVALTRIAIDVEMAFGRDLKKALFNHLQTLSLSYYNTTPVGYIIARVMSDTNRIAGLVSWGLTDVVWGLAYVIFAVVMMLAVDWRMGIVLVLMIPFMVLVTSWFQNRILKYNRVVRRENSRITGAFNEGILGARTSKTLVIEDINRKEFAGISGEMYGASVRAATLAGVYTPVILLFGAVAVAAILVRGGGFVMDGTMKLGALSALITYAVGVFDPITQMARILSDAVATQANIERVTGLLERKADIADSPAVTLKYGDVFNPKRENWEPILGDIAFEDVTFHYDVGENVLEHFSLSVKAGSCVAIVGETGAGKSTLVNLVCRFFEPVEGRILIDGRDYRERSQLWLHSSIGYVLQSPHLFSGSIRENIRYGRLDATDDEIMEAARLVSADKVIEKLAEGLDSDVGEGGDKLSTGEKQLISFARAVIADPRIFVLDEATSSIDTETERLIQNAISHILKGRTSFLIAHRLSTIKMADLILVVKDGRIVEQGTHRELLRQSGYYRELYNSSDGRIGDGE